MLPSDPTPLDLTTLGDALWQRLRPHIQEINPLSSATSWRLVPDARPMAPSTGAPVPSSTSLPLELTRRFERHGRVRTIAFDGEAGMCANTVGCRYIAALLEKPHKPIPAVELKAAMDGCSAEHLRGGTVPATDATTLREMERRYRELTEDRDESIERGDHRAQERIDREMLQIAETCRRVTGRGGRARTHSDAERVRIAVTNAVRRSCWKIAQGGAPRAAEYLRRSIRTGSMLCFVPADEDVAWIVQ